MAKLRDFPQSVPSFVSLFGKKFDEPTVLFLREGETLSVASYDAESRIYEQILSLPIDLEDPESLEIARGKLLSLVDTSRHEVITDVLVALITAEGWKFSIRT